MDIDKLGLDFIIKEEGVILHPYKDSKGIPTIGVGSTYYEDGTKVKMTDSPITYTRAMGLFHTIVDKNFEPDLNKMVKVKLTQNQFNALLSLCYNIGRAGFSTSTVLRLVNANPNDPKITDAFKMWKKAGDNPNELLGRRIREAKLYFTK